MADIDVKQRAEVYRQTLLENVIPFWLRHGLDREHGGILTCLDRDGSASVRLKGFEVKTLRYVRRKREFAETDLLERKTARG